MSSISIIPPSNTHQHQHLTLSQWHTLCKLTVNAYTPSSPPPSDPSILSLLNVLTQRYHGHLHHSYTERVAERLHELHHIIKNIYENQQQYDFQHDIPIVIIASPGRDRIFMGHTDLPGLGGFTVDAATREELFGIIQTTSQSHITLYNADTKYPTRTFNIDECIRIADAHQQTYGTRCYDPTIWSSYVQAAFTYLISPRCERYQDVRKALNIDQTSTSTSTSIHGLLLYISSPGTYALPASGGVSSSASLTGAFSMGLSYLLGLNMTLEQLARVDMAEYFLGKQAGAADKMAQLNSSLDSLVVLGSLPERVMRRITWPTKVVTVILAECQTPRLTLVAAAIPYLQKTYGYTLQQAECVTSWASSIMSRFCSLPYRIAVEQLLVGLNDTTACTAAGLSREEVKWLYTALTYDTTHGSLLRELCTNGVIEQQHESMRIRHVRNHLIYRAMKLIPIQYMYQATPTSAPLLLDLRACALYGLSEVERGWHYLSLLDAIDGTTDTNIQQQHVMELLDLVRWAHDGDRAVVDYRTLNTHTSTSTSTSTPTFAPSRWASDPHNDVSDTRLQYYCDNKTELWSVPGGFQRSLADIDDAADELHKRFDGKAAMRISAAGLGGRVVVYCVSSVSDAVSDYLRSNDWNIRQLQPAAATQILTPTFHAN